jgi:hypothetical protein
VFFAEDAETARAFGQAAVRARGAVSGTLITLKVPTSMAKDLLVKGIVGEFRGVRGAWEIGTGFERILIGPEAIQGFNSAIRNGRIVFSIGRL